MQNDRAEVPCCQEPNPTEEWIAKKAEIEAKQQAKAEEN